MKFKSSNVAENESYFEEEDWGKCFMADIIIVSVMTCINFDFENDWVFDSGYKYHLIGGSSKFSSSES